MQFIEVNNGFEIIFQDQVKIIHTLNRPFFYVGRGRENIKMYRGNYRIDGTIDEKIPLTYTGYENGVLSFEEGFTFKLLETEHGFEFITLSTNEKYNRFWYYVPATSEEAVYGLGEQMSYLNLRNKKFPIWTSEPGVGRDKSTYITWKSDVDGMSGGDYYNTNYPEPSYISSMKYYLHVDSTAYSVFDFTESDYHMLEFWDIPKKLSVKVAKTYKEILSMINSDFNRHLMLPDWVSDGIILGIQGGTEIVDKIYQTAKLYNMEISGLWCQDWQGINITSFGKRLNWNWQHDDDLYPDLKANIKLYNEENTKFLGYINPYVAVNKSLYNEAKSSNYLVLNQNDEVYEVDFGEFDCGIIDFTNPKAFEWYKSVIKREMIDFGLNGWMADFGEYLPTDSEIKLFRGDSMNLHNEWPVLWAKCNYEALSESGKLDEILYFMRAGGYGSQKYTQLLWAGDQSVDFTLHDGLATTIVGAISSGMSGNPFSHSDIGGYTSLYGNTRDKELFLRWAEMTVFTPVMRTHEGNRPNQNFQFYNDVDCISQLSRLTRIFKALKPYSRAMMEAYSETGLALQLPLLVYYDEPECKELQYQYMYGQDLLVAPVIEAGKADWEVYLPKDKWISLWSGEEYSSGVYIVEAEIGKPPVFYRKNSEYANLFETIKKIK